MAKKKSMEERVKALVAELLAEEAAEAREVGQETITDIEEAMIRISSRVAREVGIQKLADRTGPAPEHPPCPDCGQAGEHVGEHARQLVTRCGELPLTEAKYRCPKCRRHFFPSVPSAGIGS
jgi:transposase